MFHQFFSLANSSFRASSNSWRAVLPLANGLNEPNKSSGDGIDGFAQKPTLRRVSLINSTLETLSGQTSLAKPLSSHTVSFVLGSTDSLSVLGRSLAFDFSERPCFFLRFLRIASRLLSYINWIFSFIFVFAEDLRLHRQIHCRCRRLALLCRPWRWLLRRRPLKTSNV